MASWLTEYTSALETRDARERGNEAITNAYTRLADRQAVLERGHNEAVNLPQTAVEHGLSPNRPKSTTSQSARVGTATSTASDSPATRLRVDLALAQRSKSALEIETSALRAEVSTLSARAALAVKTADGLGREKSVLETKLRDREEELREKQRLVGRVQDEMVGLEIELNVAEEKMKVLRQENEDLVTRWMQTKAREAEKMNEGSGWK